MSILESGCRSVCDVTFCWLLQIRGQDVCGTEGGSWREVERERQNDGDVGSEGVVAEVIAFFL